jgi:Icc protein
MRIAWATDIHLNFLDPAELAQFCRQLAATEADAFVVTGDIAESDDVVAMLRLLEESVARPLYFVLGNHDFYLGSIAEVRREVAALCARSRWLRWLNVAGVVSLGARTALVGHDGWADGRAGSWATSTVRLNDYLLIHELSGLERKRCLEQMQALAAEGALHLRRVLPEALDGHEHVLVGTHVPPFAEACWHEGQLSDGDWLPHFTSLAAGEAILEAARAHPARRITVLCGHTHGSGVARPLANLEVRTGGAEYGAPAVQEILEVG